MTAELERNVDDLVGVPPADSTALIRVLRRFDPAYLRRLLTFIAGNEAELERTSSRSSIHANGFLKIVLSSNPGWQVRLHVWDSGNDEVAGQQESVHGHTADFASLIIVGSYRHEIFRVSANGSEYRSYRYLATRGARSFSLSPAGPTMLDLASEALLPAGTIYAQLGDVLHRVIPSDGLTASLVIQGPTRYSEVRVLTETELPTSSARPVTPLKTSTLSDYVNRLLTVPGFPVEP